jgi:hypothetical protein
LAARFWEHAIRKEGDYERHVEYLNYNPVKHGHVTRESDWPFDASTVRLEAVFLTLNGRWLMTFGV